MMNGSKMHKNTAFTVLHKSTTWNTPDNVTDTKSSVENVMNSYAHLGLISQDLCATENVYLELITYNNNLEVDPFIVSAYR